MESEALSFNSFKKTMDVQALSAEDNCHSSSNISNFEKWIMIPFLKSPLSHFLLTKSYIYEIKYDKKMPKTTPNLFKVPFQNLSGNILYSTWVSWLYYSMKTFWRHLIARWFCRAWSLKILVSTFDFLYITSLLNLARNLKRHNDK